MVYEIILNYIIFIYLKIKYIILYHNKSRHIILNHFMSYYILSYYIYVYIYYYTCIYIYKGVLIVFRCQARLPRRKEQHPGGVTY